VAYLAGAAGPDVEAVAVALEHAQAALPPVVLTELLSDPKVIMPVKDLFLQLPLLEITEGFWHRLLTFLRAERDNSQRRE
jgi:hypothetical protein